MITRIFYRTLVGPLLLLAFLLGRADASEAMLGEIYNRSAQDHGPARNPVILIPGILGSTLEEKQTGEVVWGGFTRSYANPGTAAGARLFALPMQIGTPLSRLRDDVVPTGALSELRLSLLGIPVDLHAYKEFCFRWASVALLTKLSERTASSIMGRIISPVSNFLMTGVAT